MIHWFVDTGVPLWAKLRLSRNRCLDLVWTTISQARQSGEAKQEPKQTAARKRAAF